MQSSVNGKPRLLWIGHAGTFTGMSSVTHAICDRLHGLFDITILAAGYVGDPHQYPYRLIPVGDAKDRGVSLLPVALRQVKPDVIVIFEDWWYVNHFLSAFGSSHPPILAYIPVDGSLIPVPMATGLNQCKTVIATTQWGADQLVSSGCKQPQVIPHGVDPFFHRLPAEKRSQLRQVLGLDPDAWVIFWGHRNQARKDLPKALEGFARFAYRYPEAKSLLWLHCEKWHDQGWAVDDLTERICLKHGISPKKVFRSDAVVRGNHPNWSKDQLNGAYNVADVGLNCSQGEGWGNPAFEHALTGAVQIVPNHSAPSDLWPGFAYLLYPSAPINSLQQGHEYQLIHPITVELALEWLWLHPTERRYLAEAGQQFARSFSWDWVAARFAEVLAAALQTRIGANSWGIQAGVRLEFPYAQIPGGIFNPSLIWVGDRCLGIARAEQVPYTQRTNLTASSAIPWVFELAETGELLSQRPIPFGSPFQPGTYRIDDFRLFVWQGRVLVSHVLFQKGGSVRQAVSEYKEEKLRLLWVWEASFPLQPVEKNWCFWNHHGRLLCLYDLCGKHPVLEMSDPGWLVPVAGDWTGWVPDLEPFGVDPGLYLSISSSPVLWDERHLFFTMHQRDPQGIYRHWGVLLNCQTLEWEAVSNGPILEGGEAQGNHRGFALIGSAHRYGGELWLAVGEGDQFSRVLRIPLDCLEFTPAARNF